MKTKTKQYHQYNDLESDNNQLLLHHMKGGFYKYRIL